MRSPLADLNLLNWRFTPVTRRPLPPINVQFQLKTTLMLEGVRIRPNRRPPRINGVVNFSNDVIVKNKYPLSCIEDLFR